MEKQKEFMQIVNTINDICILYTTKNLAEILVILCLIVPMIVFVIKERGRE